MFLGQDIQVFCKTTSFMCKGPEVKERCTEMLKEVYHSCRKGWGKKSRMEAEVEEIEDVRS